MKTLKINISRLLFGVLLFSTLTSCDEGGDPDAGGTTTEAFAGEWFISIMDADGTVEVDHALHATYNTAANDNTMWIDDWITKYTAPTSTPTGWYLRSKLTVDLATGTFTAVDQPNLNDSGTVTITEGKILKKAGTSRGGHVVDSIYFKAEFSYDPGTILTFAGTKRTGFLEDEY